MIFIASEKKEKKLFQTFKRAIKNKNIFYKKYFLHQQTNIMRLIHYFLHFEKGYINQKNTRPTKHMQSNTLIKMMSKE